MWRDAFQLQWQHGLSLVIRATTNHPILDCLNAMFSCVSQRDNVIFPVTRHCHQSCCHYFRMYVLCIAASRNKKWRPRSRITVKVH